MYYKNELVYIGMTMRDFAIRWEEHKNNIIKGSKELKVYE
jgi:predicted GIY-YIG superfamily endonuclease